MSEERTGLALSRETDSELQGRYAGVGGVELLEAVIKVEFPGRVALVSSFGAHSVVLLDMVARVDPTAAVIFLQTGKLFAETGEYRKMLTAKLGLQNVQEVEPTHADLAMHDPDGTLWQRDQDKCCTIRKSLPLDRALVDFDAWITGRKRYQGGERENLETLEYADGKWKVNPLAHWSRGDIDSYLRERELPAHPLFEHGYLSIGCEPCTSPVAEGHDERSGRWADSEKKECGIHRPRYRSDY